MCLFEETHLPFPECTETSNLGYVWLPKSGCAHIVSNWEWPMPFSITALCPVYVSLDTSGNLLVLNDGLFG